MGQAYRQTLYIGNPFCWKYDTAPIKPQAHGDHSEAISFRNLWVRELNWSASKSRSLR
jgi:hypothetical protein